jgi:hypothetical protein
MVLNDAVILLAALFHALPDDVREPTRQKLLATADEPTMRKDLATALRLMADPAKHGAWERSHLPEFHESTSEMAKVIKAL